MKKHLLTVALLTLCTLGMNAASPKKKNVSPEQKGVEAINLATAEAHIGFLACDELEGREAGWKGGRIAGNYIISCLKQMGLQPLYADYVEPFEVAHAERQVRGKRWEVHPDSIAKLKQGVHQKLDLRNILCKIEGKSPNEIVIIGAHYDHLGYDPMLAGDQIYNGADDNASGVQAVLQVAKAFLATGVQPERTVIFAFWDGEEKGLLGSRYFAMNYPDIKKVKGYLNYDMIGRNNRPNEPTHFVYFYTAAHKTFEDWLKKDIETFGLQLTPDVRAWDNPIGGSDNGTFAKLDIPIIWYHTDAHPDYHLPGDQAERLNWPKVVDITKASFLAMWKLANEKEY